MDHDPTLAEVVDWMQGRYFGKYRGTVVDNADVNQQGRLQVEVPGVLGSVHLWAMPCVPYAGDGVGLYLIPDTGTGVWVEFEGGDPSYPIWTGCFWGAGQLPDTPFADVKVLRTNRHTIRLDDTMGELLVSSDSGAQTAYTADAVTTAGTSTHTVSPSSISSTKGLGSVEVTDTGTSINGAGLEVT